MTRQHQQAVDKLTALHKDNPVNIALIICGSLATGKARDDSDVDLYLVVTEEEFLRVSQSKAWFYGTWDPRDFFGMEIDGKIISMQFLREAAADASEPTRASFQDAYTLFSHNPEVDALIKKIAVYPVWEQEKRIKAFSAYVKHFRYIGADAYKAGNTFFFMHCIMELVFFAGRLVLAHNSVLFPCHKALFTALEKCKNQPEGFIEMSRQLLAHMHVETMLAYYEKIVDYFKVYAYPDQERIGLILENEWTWFTRKMTIAEW